MSPYRELFVEVEIPLARSRGALVNRLQSADVRALVTLLPRLATVGYGWREGARVSWSEADREILVRGVGPCGHAQRVELPELAAHLLPPHAGDVIAAAFSTQRWCFCMLKERV